MGKKTNLSAGDLSRFCEQLAVLYGSGMNQETALAILAENSGGSIARASALLSAAAANGRSLADSASESGMFPDYFIKLADIGEKSGRLDETLSALHVYYDRMDKLKENINRAVRYPIIMVVVMLAVLTLILTEAMPIFASVYDQIGQSMSGSMVAMLAVGSFISKHFLIIIAVIGLLAAALGVFFHTRAGAAARSWLYENSFLTRKTAGFDGRSRVTYALSMCLTSGFDISSALDMPGGLIDSKAMQKRMEQAKSLLAADKSAAAALRESGILPQKYAAMIEVGERSGCLEKFMRRVCELCEQDADRAAERVIASIEPTVVIVMSVLIGLLLVSVMLPLLSVMAGI